MIDLSPIQQLLQPFIDRLATRLLPNPKKNPMSMRRLKLSQSLYSEMRACKEIQDNLRLELLGEGVFSAYVPGHVLHEILERSPCPFLDIKTYFKCQRRIAPRLEGGRIAPKYPIPSINKSLFGFLSTATACGISVWIGAMLLHHSPTNWWRTIPCFIFGIFMGLATWALLKDELEYSAARTLIQSLYPQTPEELVIEKQKYKLATKRRWKLTAVFVICACCLIPISIYFGVTGILILLAIAIISIISIQAWRDFHTDI